MEVDIRGNIFDIKFPLDVHVMYGGMYGGQGKGHVRFDICVLTSLLMS